MWKPGEKIRYTTNYDQSRIVPVLVRHVETENNVRQKQGDPKKDRIGGRQPRAKIAPSGPEQARRFARYAPGRLEEILGSEFVVVGLARSLSRRTKVTSEIVRAEWGLNLPIKRKPDLAELHKGYRIFGGHQGCLRVGIENEAYQKRRQEEDWDFRHGRPEWNRWGLHRLSRAQTEREAGAGVLRVINCKPPVPEDAVKSGLPLVYIAFGHGMSIARGVAMAIHGNDPNMVGITAQQAADGYKLSNANALVLGQCVEDWEELGRIITPAQL